MQELIDKFIGNDRFSSYKNLSDYCENIKYAQNFYSILNIFEIALRNKVNIFYTEKYTSNWLLDRHSHDIEVKKAIDKIIKSKPHYNNSDLVGALNFGFWVKLFDYKYLVSHKLQVTKIQNIFGWNKKIINRQNTINLHKDLNFIKNCRNRIFHHEKMLNHKNDSYNKFEQLLHKLIHQLDEKRFLEKLLYDFFNIKLLHTK